MSERAAAGPGDPRPPVALGATPRHGRRRRLVAFAAAQPLVKGALVFNNSLPQPSTLTLMR